METKAKSVWEGRLRSWKKRIHREISDTPKRVIKKKSQYSDVKSVPPKKWSVVDKRWEAVDPKPNVQTLMKEFNRRFFWGRLSKTTVKWSKRMTRSAGLCYYRKKQRKCDIHLSEPLFKQRNRADLVRILLHEMIHAFVFLTKEEGGHGLHFQRHAKRINKLTGARITVYHNFFREMEQLQQHWWHCNGPCGMNLKRSINRAPSPKEPWVLRHRISCGGSFKKIKEPKDYKKNSRREV